MKSAEAVVPHDVFSYVHACDQEHYAEAYDHCEEAETVCFAPATSVAPEQLMEEFYADKGVPEASHKDLMEFSQVETACKSTSQEVACADDASYYRQVFSEQARKSFSDTFPIQENLDDEGSEPVILFVENQQGESYTEEDSQVVAEVDSNTEATNNVTYAEVNCQRRIGTVVQAYPSDNGTVLEKDQSESNDEQNYELKEYLMECGGNEEYAQEYLEDEQLEVLASEAHVETNQLEPAPAEGSNDQYYEASDGEQLDSRRPHSTLERSDEKHSPIPSRREDHSANECGGNSTATGLTVHTDEEARETAEASAESERIPLVNLPPCVDETGNEAFVDENYACTPVEELAAAEIDSGQYKGCDESSEHSQNVPKATHFPTSKQHQKEKKKRYSEAENQQYHEAEDEHQYYDGGSEEASYAHLEQQYYEGSEQQFSESPGQECQEDPGSQLHYEEQELEYSDKQDQQYYVGQQQEYNEAQEQQYSEDPELDHSEGLEQQYSEDPQCYSEGIEQQYYEGPQQRFSKDLEQQFSRDQLQEYSQDLEQQNSEDVQQEYPEDPQEEYSENLQQQYSEYSQQEYYGDSEQQYYEEPQQQYYEDPQQEYSEATEQQYLEYSQQNSEVPEQQYDENLAQQYYDDPEQQYYENSEQRYNQESEQQYYEGQEQEYYEGQEQEYCHEGLNQQNRGPVQLLEELKLYSEESAQYRDHYRKNRQDDSGHVEEDSVQYLGDNLGQRVGDCGLYQAESGQFQEASGQYERAFTQSQEDFVHWKETSAQHEEGSVQNQEVPRPHSEESGRYQKNFVQLQEPSEQRLSNIPLLKLPKLDDAGTCSERKSNAGSTQLDKTQVDRKYPYSDSHEEVHGSRTEQMPSFDERDVTEKFKNFQIDYDRLGQFDSFGYCLKFLGVRRGFVCSISPDGVVSIQLKGKQLTQWQNTEFRYDPEKPAKKIEVGQLYIIERQSEGIRYLERGRVKEICRAEGIVRVDLIDNGYEQWLPRTEIFDIINLEELERLPPQAVQVFVVGLTNEGYTPAEIEQLEREWNSYEEVFIIPVDAPKNQLIRTIISQKTGETLGIRAAPQGVPKKVH